LTGSGVALIGLRHAKEALEPLTAALRIRERSETPELAAETRFALARAIWESGGDRRRARASAEMARAEYAKTVNGARDVAKIGAWLAERAGR
jgi:eukaryotic-like serine/threonine-protein kinase